MNYLAYLLILPAYFKYVTCSFPREKLSSFLGSVHSPIGKGGGGSSLIQNKLFG